MPIIKERRRDISWCRRRRRRRRSSAATEKLAFPNALTPLSDDQNHYTETPQGANREIKGLLLVRLSCRFTSHGFYYLLIVHHTLAITYPKHMLLGGGVH
ncbi:hypothetical protein ACJW31_06G008900 [Castanea mollissima]